MSSGKRYYWLKLQRDFFKRHDIRIIENMPNGKDYILFYLKLLVESIDHNGSLRFSDTIPYNEEMLCTITDTNIDIVRAAMKVFTELGLIEIFDDQTIFMTEVQKMIGSETKWAVQKRNQRNSDEKQSGQFPPDVHMLSATCPPDKEKDKDKEKDIYYSSSPDGDGASKGIPDGIPTESQCNEMFDTFWKAYPRKIGKQAARNSFINAFRVKKRVKQRGYALTLEMLLNALSKQKQWSDWQRDGGKYIPHASTWLNQERWEDQDELDYVEEDLQYDEGDSL